MTERHVKLSCAGSIVLFFCMHFSEWITCTEGNIFVPDNDPRENILYQHPYIINVFSMEIKSL